MIRALALSRNVDIPAIIPATAAVSAPPLHLLQASPPRPSGQPNIQPAQPSQTSIGPPAEQATSVPPSIPSQTRAPSLGVPIEAAVTGPASEAATDQLLLRVWSNFVEYLTSIPNVFVNEHVISSVTTARSSVSKSPVHDSEMYFTTDTTVDSIFPVHESLRSPG